MSDIQQLIYGRDKTQRITNIEVNGSNLELFIEKEDGTIVSEFKQNQHWILTPYAHGNKSIPLNGNLHYKHALLFNTQEEWYNAARYFASKDSYLIWNVKEAAMIKSGVTCFKGMKSYEPSILSFDIETTSLNPHDPKANVLIIANTFRKQGKITRKLFAYNDYSLDVSEAQKPMIEAWTKWVREMNPSILLGYNINSFDLVYLETIARREETTLALGRDGSDLWFNKNESKFRKDGSQFYTYKKVNVYGRDVIDGFFVALRYDVGRKYESYKLKQLIKQENLEVKDRVFYDGEQIRHKYHIPEEFEKIKQYACFAPKSSLITLENGSTKFIEDIENGDTVIDCYGKPQQVFEKLERDYDGLLYSFNIDGGRKILNVTPEHPFYVLNEKTLKYEWIKAQDLKINHLLVRGEKAKTKKALKFRDDLMWLFGLYQADGYIRKNNKNYFSLIITQHKNQCQTILQTLDKLNYKYSIVKKGNTKAVDIVVSNHKLADLFLRWTNGKFKSPEKRLSRECFDILNNNPRLAINFLAGLLDGDGHLRKTKNQGESFQLSLCTTSPHLANIIDLLSSSMELNLTRQNFRTRPHRKVNYINGQAVRSKHQFYELTFFTEASKEINQYLKIKQRTDLLRSHNKEVFKKHVRIKKIEATKYSGKVHNISVTGTHSYISNGLISHNCFDGDDALNLYDLMIPAVFYFTQSIPKPFQLMTESASGSQLNALLVRSYLQNKHSIPKADESVEFEGAISHGIPGVHKNVLSFDVASLYPSVMLEYKIYPKHKDPQQHVLKVLEYFTNERLKNKKLAKDTKDKYYDDLQNSQKVGINSMYGFLGSSGLNFNYPHGASEVTRRGREVLGTAIKWATGKTYEEWKPKEEVTNENSD